MTIWPRVAATSTRAALSAKSPAATIDAAR
jgi:hypothetical protein